MAQVLRSKCDVLLIWPDAFLSIWGDMIKDRVEVINRDLGIPVFPLLEEIWLYEDKRRMVYWMQAHNVPHPRTWIFYNVSECRDFIASCDLPIVFKASFGAASSGVRVMRKRMELDKLVTGVFKRGFLPNGCDRRDRQWGSVLLQEYHPDVKEWRMVRIGRSFFGHRKGQVNNSHSGSSSVIWDVPQKKHLDFLEKVTDKGGFRSMNVDTFETPDGRLMANELQTVFGASYSVDQLRVDDIPGRFLRDPENCEWIFEPGDFARNACANERIRYVIDTAFRSQSRRSIERLQMTAPGAKLKS
ncbi:hypothetical protein ACFLU6_00635 [Acidobacteriota bacterium]